MHSIAAGPHTRATIQVVIVVAAMALVSCVAGHMHEVHNAVTKAPTGRR